MPASIHVSQPLEASRRSIWQAISEPHGISCWQADTASGGLAERRFVLGWPSLGVKLPLEVLTAEPEKRLVLQNGDTLLELEVGDKKLDLCQRGLEPEDDLEGMQASWQVALCVLAHYLKFYEGQARQVHWAARSIATTAELAHVFFTDRAALGSWLTQGDGAIGDTGQELRVTGHWGKTLQGQVLLRQPGRDVVLALTGQHEGVLILRTLPSPITETSRLVALVWSHFGKPVTSDLPTHLEGALGRLQLVLESGGGA